MSVTLEEAIEWCEKIGEPIIEDNEFFCATDVWCEGGLSGKISDGKVKLDYYGSACHYGYDSYTNLRDTLGTRVKKIVLSEPVCENLYVFYKPDREELMDILVKNDIPFNFKSATVGGPATIYVPYKDYEKAREVISEEICGSEF